MGRRVVTLTNHPRDEEKFGSSVTPFPYTFQEPEKLQAAMQGADVLYNTYWVRFSHGVENFERAVENTKILIKAAKAASLRRIVHVSIANPSLDSAPGYYRGKALVEGAVKGSGLSYAILRPTVIFGKEDILVNNIAWFLRHFPLFALPGNGEYKIQPIFVDDFAETAVAEAAENENRVLNAVGPETYTFKEFARLIGKEIGCRRPLISFPPAGAFALLNVVGFFLGDVVLTREEISGLMDGLLVSLETPRGKTQFSDWIKSHADDLGRKYASEIGRHWRRPCS